MALLLETAPMAAKRQPDLNELWELILGLPLDQQQALLQKAKHYLPANREDRIEPAAIWDEILALGESISAEDSAKLPHDGSIHYKHYLYGHSKDA